MENEGFRDGLTSLILWLIGVYVQMPNFLQESIDWFLVGAVGPFLTAIL